MKSPDDLQQQVYSAVLSMSRSSRDGDGIITVRNKQFFKSVVKVTKYPFLQCLGASGIPMRQIKHMKAKCEEVTEEDWEAFYIQTESGTILDIKCVHAAYSPRILEMLQSHTLRNFR